MSTLVLFNPMAGKKVAEHHLDFLKSRYEGDILFRDLTKIDDYAAFFSGLTETDRVILCGGDGTLNRFANATQEIDFPCDVLYCPLGSGNDFWNDLGNPDKQTPLRINDYIKDLPVVYVGETSCRFLNNVGFGLDGYCCETGDQMKKVSDKPVNYTAIAIKGLLFKYKPSGATVTVDGKEYRYKKVWTAPAMKGRYYGGGMMAAPAQDRNDPEGTLSLMVFHRTGSLRTLMIFPSIFKGEHVNHKKAVVVHTGKEITVTFDRPATLQIDGETITGVTSYRALAKAPVKAEV